MENDKTRYEVIAVCTAHEDQAEGYADVTRDLEVGTILWARVGESETRTLNGHGMEVVRFWINGGTTDYWLPRDVFNLSTKRLT